jgi:predicted transcriptional regulator
MSVGTPLTANDPRAYRGGRPHGLNDPERVKLAAAMFVEGASRADMSEELGVSQWTITQWRKDPRVRAQVAKLVEDRVMRIVGKTDHIIEGRLQNAEDMDTELLLRIRKEFLGGAFRALHEGGKVDEATIYEAMGEVEADPELLSGLRELIARRQEAQSKEKEEQNNA